MTSKLNFHLLFRNIVWVIAILAITHTSHAQTIPGRWHKVALPQSSGYNILDFSFIDSLNGLSLTENGLISSTSNGGTSWELDTNLSPIDIDKFNLNSVECTAPRHGFFHGDEASLTITPGGCLYRIAPNYNEVNWGEYITLAEKMYDTSYGFRIVNMVIGSELGGATVAILVTYDGWQSSALYGSVYIDSTAGNLPSSSYEPLSIGYVVDSNDVWAAEGSIQDSNNIIIHTSNGGESWQTYHILDSLVSQTQVKDFLVNPQTREVYYMGNFGKHETSFSGSDIDYAYSNNYGNTWSFDSTFGINLWRLANPSPGILWAMLGEGGYGTVGIYPNFTFINHNDYSRKIGYSSDSGITWSIDSTTFINDSLEEMHFVDARHGWIASWSNDSLFMWYYDADDNSEVVEHGFPNATNFVVFPNPAQSWITVSGALETVSFTDVLGRTRICPGNGNMFNVSSLPTGIYIASDGQSRAKFVKE